MHDVNNACNKDHNCKKGHFTRPDLDLFEKGFIKDTFASQSNVFKVKRKSIGQWALTEKEKEKCVKVHLGDHEGHSHSPPPIEKKKKKLVGKPAIEDINMFELDNIMKQKYGNKKPKAE